MDKLTYYKEKITELLESARNDGVKIDITTTGISYITKVIMTLSKDNDIGESAKL